MQGKERLNTWSTRDYIKNIWMLALKLPIWLAQVLCFWVPMKKNRIILYSLKQRGYSCNLKYLTEQLRRQERAPEYLWIVRERTDLENLQRRGIPAAMLHSRQHILWRLRSHIVITNDEFYPMFLKRPGQVYINTWHGGINYKKIGYAGLEFTNPIQKWIYRLNNPRPDHFISGSRSFSQTTAEAFGFPEHIFREWGMPRNDCLCFPANREKTEKIKSRLGICPEEKTVLYAPTFRKGGFAPGIQLDILALRKALADRFGGEWTVLVRQHYFVRQQEQTEGVVDVSDYEDMQELLQCCDCLISDYSSTMWDYLLTGKPCFVFAPDLEEYHSSDRAFFVPPHTWPYSIAGDMEGLCCNIANFDSEDFARRVALHRKTQGSFDDGRATERLCRLLNELCDDQGENNETCDNLWNL